MESLTLMPKYEVYKNSGEDWIGDIPSGWDLVPIRSIFKFRNEKNSPVKTEEILDRVGYLQSLRIPMARHFCNRQY